MPSKLTSKQLFYSPLPFVRCLQFTILHTNKNNILVPKNDARFLKLMFWWKTWQP